MALKLSRNIMACDDSYNDNNIEVFSSEMMNEIFRIIEPQSDTLISETGESSSFEHLPPNDGTNASFDPNHHLALPDETSYEQSPESVHYQNYYQPCDPSLCYVTDDNCSVTSGCADIRQPYYTGYPQPCTTTLPAFQTSFPPYYAPVEVKTEDDSEFVDQSSFMCRKGKRGAKNVLLWKFILEQLRSGTESIRWVNLLTGTFRFVDTTDISRKWGEKKRKSDMNFEKLSRGIRHYYKSGFMSREDGTRLVYRFHWSKVPRAWRPREVQYEFDRRCRKHYQNRL
ncbi:retroviral integration site protein Fli-1 homolog isoform X2 [Saccostrea cucullata]|uniref:retroviral integration site protein Fli-1 homolog isoform X2 n=1 Tax=Saccostrea cuccullata TaxID=36930 RepID=UPI002ED497BC